jgi:NAD(P)-dependent dehydrogenase (short-subunit alcohol dehydrogenase family)
MQGRDEGDRAQKLVTDERLPQEASAMRLEHKVAVVSGASAGIGEAIARRYAAEGAFVAVGYGHDAPKADAVVSSIEAAGGKAKAYGSDWSKITEIETMVASVRKDVGPIDILVNNAGIFRTVSIEDTSEDIWDDQIDLNLKGVFFAIRAVVPEMKARRYGKIINVSSIAGVNAFPNCPAYCASKAGVLNLTKAAACELSPFAINVNGIAPGNVETPLNAHLRGEPGYIERMAKMTPSGIAFLKPQDLTGTAVYLASEDSALVHGVTIVVDAGWTAW